MRDEWGFIVACLFKPLSFDSRAAHIMAVKEKETVKAGRRGFVCSSLKGNGQTAVSNAVIPYSMEKMKNATHSQIA